MIASRFRPLLQPNSKQLDTDPIRFRTLPQNTRLERAISATDGFGRDARSIMNTLGNIKNPEQVTDSLKENPEKIKVLK